MNAWEEGIVVETLNKLKGTLGNQMCFSGLDIQWRKNIDRDRDRDRGRSDFEIVESRVNGVK